MVLALLSASTVVGPSAPAALAPAPPALFVRSAAPPPTDGVELVGEHDAAPPASTTVVQATPGLPSTLAPTEGGRALVATSAGAAPGLPSVPVALLAAYRAAVAGAPSGCHLPVSLLAAIGQVESGSLAGRSVDVHHRAVPGVYGPVLSGGGYAAIHDSDGGSLDGDASWDRAVGPMQFIPGTWRAFGRDGDGDGARDPQNVFDAAASAAAYLCLGGRDLRDAADLQSAVLSYNHSTAYVDLVLSWQLRLAGGVAERADTGPVGTGPADTLLPPVPSTPILAMVVAAAASPPLVMVVRTPARSTPAPTGPTVAPAPHPAPRPPSAPHQTPTDPDPVTAPAPALGTVAAPSTRAVDPPIAAARAVDPPVTASPAAPAMMTVMTPIEVTLTPDPPAAVTPIVVTPPVVAPAAVTPTVVTPTVVTPTPNPPTTPASAACPAVAPPPAGAPVPPSSPPVPPEPAVEALGCVATQPPATTSLPVDPPLPAGPVPPPAVLSTEPTPTG